MIVGIILFVVAIGGTVVALAMAVKVGDLQAKFTDQEIVSSDSDLYDQTLFDAVKAVIGDVQNFDQLSLETLYDHYGIGLLQGVGGIDFTNKDFYSAPLKDIMGDFSIIVNSFTLRDISGLTGNDFETYNLPILTENLDNNVKTALDNILGSIKGDLTVRTIKTKLIPDFNVENDLIKALQDIPFSSFGSAINAFRLCTFLDVNTDTFVPSGAVKVFVKVDRYEEVSKADLAQKGDFVYKDGVELFSADAVDTDADGKTDKMVERELRFANKGTAEAPNYVVDNSCYGTDFDANATETKFYRHVEYAEYQTGTTYPDGTEYFVKGFANRITSFDNETAPGTFELYFKGFLSLKDLYAEEAGDKVELNGKVTGATIDVNGALYKKGEGEGATYEASTQYTIKDETIKKNSKLMKKDFESTRTIYLRVHEGTSKPLLQSFAYITLAELQDMDDFVDNVTVGDVIEVKEDSSKILKALKDTKFGDISTKIDSLVIDEVIDVVFDEYTVNNVDGEYVYIESEKEGNFVLYNAKRHPGMQRYARTEIPGDPITYEYTPSEDGAYVKNGYFFKYANLTDAEKALDPVRYTKNPDITNASSLIMQALALRGAKTNELGKITDDLCIYEVVDMAADDTSRVMKALAKRDCKIKEIGSVIDDLYIDDVIEIKDDSSLVMKSLAKRKCKIKDLGKITDELSLKESMKIVMDNFVLDDVNGVFVCVEDVESYIPYDEVENLGWDRFVKVGDAWVAYDSTDPAHEGLVQYVHGRYYTLYNPAVHTSVDHFYTREEVAGSSSKVLQRFANTTLGKFTDAFTGLILGDVLKIEADRYAVADADYLNFVLHPDHADEQYFYYEATDGLYLLANAEYRAAHPDDTFYRVEKVGKSKKIIKKLAYAKVDNLSSAIDKIMDDMFLSDLIDIYDHYQVVETTDPVTDASKFLLLSDGTQDEAGNDIVYVYDNSGKYIKSPIEYAPATDLELGSVSNSIYGWTAAPNDKTNPADVAQFTVLMSSGNIYYKDGTEYINNIPLCTYVFYSDSAAQKANLYYREAGAGAEVFPQYDGTDLYVKVMGSYIAYDSNNPAHSNMDIYCLHTSTTVEGYRYYVRLDEYRSIYVKNNAGTWQPCPATDGDKVALFTDGATQKYARQYCEDVYVEDVAGDYVFFDGRYVAYDAGNSDHDGLTRCRVERGFVASKAQVHNGAYITDNPALLLHVTITKEKSSAVLRMMKEKQVTMKSMGKAVADATIDDLMDIQPDSIFDKAEIKVSTINNLGSTMSNMMNTMKIGDLLDWANITSVQPNVKSAIEDAKLTDFFTSLQYSNGAITVNMLKLYGVE